MLSLVAFAALAASPGSYAIVVGNNASPTLARRALQYADDDAVKYFEVLKGLLGPEQVRLLTVADADTARLYPQTSALAVPPTRANVVQAFEQTAALVKAAHEAGQKTRVYFAFAGHGDVDQGRGFLELQDGAFTGDDMEKALKGLGADEIHVILDSCNSFFVLSPRKPGGRHFTTPKDAALQLAERLPNVGVLLSTSAEAEVYEWSELQSGIFSHAVRSALTGVADVDGDGRVSYAEMAGFIDTATRSVPNPNFRPRVFSRGPNGDGASALVSFEGFSGVQVSAQSDKPLRLTIRDAEGVRWFDLHAEAKVPLKLRLPALDLTVERIDGDQVRAYALGSAKTAELSQLEARPLASAPRGAGEALRALYATPFGPEAFTAWQAQAEAEEQKPTEYIGLAKADLDRMHIILDEAAVRDRNSRMTATFVSLAGALSLAGLGVGEAALAPSTVGAQQRWAVAGIGVTAGLLFAGTSFFTYFYRSAWERQAMDFEASLARGDWQGAVADADAFMDEQAASRRVGRYVAIGAGIAGVVVGVGGYVVYSTYLRNSDVSIFGRSISLLCAALGAAALINLPWLREYDDDLLNVWRRERKLADMPSITGIDIAPANGGATFSLSGTF